ncbi:MAG TPA: tetratricopeptide repeat protein [Bryobacteraceae bacterium]|nr:tetratricopeptide repeat protein [Bryobacteraceae bacterium]
MKSLGLLLCAVPVVFAGSSQLEQARQLYDTTNFEQSLKVLQAIPQKDAEVYALMGRNYYMESDYKRATDALEKAVAAEPTNSEYFMWLARGYGRRAETSSMFTAPGYASRARQYFEKSVQLDPRNLEAMNDLFEYYLDAPGFLGGGADKAAALSARIGKIDAAEGHWAQAKLAEKRKEYRSAEDQLRRAIDLAPHQVGRFIDLARFLSKQGRYQEADQSIARAEAIAPNSPQLIYAKADIYIQTGRNLDVAKDLLKRYLSLALSPDDPPRSDALRLLRQAQGG